MTTVQFNRLLQKLSDKYDTPVGSMEYLSDAKSISTRNVALDWITGIGGLPVGRSVELFGPPSSGKTTLALQVVAEVQSRGMTVAYVDYEQAMDRQYAASLGVNISDIVFFQPDTFEDGADIAEKMICTGEIDLIVFDSVAAMTPRALFDAESGKATVAVQARLMHQLMQKFNPLLKKWNVCAVFLNHTREVLGTATRPGMPAFTTTPGGLALKYYASMRIEFKHRGMVQEELESALTLEKGKSVQGAKTLAKVVKNKVGPPHREALLRMYHGKGFSQAYSAFQVLLSHKRIAKKTGGIFTVKEPELQAEWMSKSDGSGIYVKGEANLLRGLEGDAVTLQKWVEAAKDILSSPQTDTSLEDELEAITQDAAPAKPNVLADLLGLSSPKN